MLASESQIPALSLDALMQLYCGQQGRALRLFDRSLNVLWDNAPDRLGRFPAFQDAHSSPLALPPAGPERLVWPVTRAFGDGKPAERTYWLGGGAEENRGFRVRAWILADDPQLGPLAIEEIEEADPRQAPGVRIRELDSELADLIHQVAEFLANNDRPGPLHLRLTNPHLDRRCHEVRECGKADCAARNRTDQLRCWEVSHQQCDSNGTPIEDPLEKLHYCEECEVFLAACPDPLTRVGENLNRLLSLLQMKHHEALEAQQQVQQAEKMATIGELMAGLAHEIKTPLSVIIGRLECIKMELDPAAHGELEEDLEVMHGHAVRAVRIMDDVLSLARPQPPHLRPMRINPEIEQAASMLRKTLKKSDITVNLDLAARLPDVKADPLQMQQVFCNLILNARDAMRGGGHVTIRSWLRRGNSPAVMVSVADNGGGIESEALGRIFSPFYSTKRDKGGTGLGLAICQRIMIYHGGRIDVESEIGKGAAFTIALPLTGEEGTATL